MRKVTVGGLQFQRAYPYSVCGGGMGRRLNPWILHYRVLQDSLPHPVPQLHETIGKKSSKQFWMTCYIIYRWYSVSPPHLCESHGESMVKVIMRVWVGKTRLRLNPKNGVAVDTKASWIQNSTVQVVFIEHLHHLAIVCSYKGVKERPDLAFTTFVDLLTKEKLN